MHSTRDLVLQDPDRFWQRVEKRGPNDCWPFSGYNCNGYQMYRPAGRRVLVGAHRAAVYISGRDIPDDLVVDHRCFNRACVNPAHLQVVTREWNSGNRERPLVTHCAECGEQLPIKATKRGSRLARCNPCVWKRQRDAVNARKSEIVPCPYCGKEMRRDGVRIHQRNACPGGNQR